MSEKPFLGGYTPGFRGSAWLRGTTDEVLIHAVSRRNHHFTVCNREIARHYDRVYMCTGGNMETVTCVWCWVGKDPFP